MTQRLLEKVRDILEECDALNSPADKSMSLEEDSFILRNPHNEKSILIGEAELEDGIGKQIIAFKINVLKWRWAEDEGFTKDDIIDKFSEEIFTKIDLDSIPYYLTEV